MSAYSRASQPRRFVIVTTQRSGSTLLVQSLDSSPRIFCAGEIFHPGAKVHHREFQFPHARAGGGPLSRLLGAFGSGARIRSHLGGFYEQAGAGVEAVGFKLMVSQLRRFPAVMPTLRDSGARFLYLYRDDVDAAARSYQRARTTGVYHSNRLAGLGGRSESLPDEDEFTRIVERCRVNKQEVLRLSDAYDGAIFTYEQMTRNWDSFIAAVGAEIGIVGLRVEQALAKLPAEEASE
jgi:LPS sulfotransferase NodH